MIRGALTGLAGIGMVVAGAVGFGYTDIMGPSPPAIRVIDGDTLVIDGERIRLNGIDAAEMHGCPAGRRCYVGPDPIAARESLSMAMTHGGAVRVNRLKKDRYGRTVAQVTVGDLDVSCWQIEGGMAEYRRDWDEGHIMEGSCE